MIYRFGQCEVDTGRRQFRVDGTAVDVQPKIFDLLVYLIEHRERVVDKDELFDKVWPNTVVSESSLTQAIRRARALIGDDGDRQTVIRTVQRHGYQFVSGVGIMANDDVNPQGVEVASGPMSGWPVGVFLLILLATAAAIGYMLFDDPKPKQIRVDAQSNPFLGKSTVQRTASREPESGPDWSPDGQSIVYVSNRHGNPDLWISGPHGQERPLTAHQAEEAQPAWSPDGRHVAFVSSRDHGDRLDQSVMFGYTLGGGIWIVPVSVGESVSLVDGGFNPDWSPDGTQMVFDASFGGPRRIWICDVEQCEPRQISDDATNVAVHTRPAWAPDGRWVAYERQEGSQSTSGSLHLAPTDGGESVQIADATARNFSPAWVGPESLIFASDRRGAINLWKIEIDSDSGEPVGEPLQVTRGAGSDLDPAVAADGRLAYVELRRLQNLWQVEIDPETWTVKGEPERVSNASWNDIAPALSQDLEQLVFVSDRSGGSDIWLMDLAAGDLTELVASDGQDLQPDWSPDGRHIAYFSNASGNNEIWIASVDGGAPVQITNNSADDSNPYWSPDGRSIAFMSDRGGSNEIWVMDADGSNPVKVSDVIVTGHTVRWSPDGRWIIFTSDVNAGRDIYVAASDGSRTRRLTTGESLDAHPLWAPDSDVFLYLDGHQKVYVRGLEDEEPELLFDLGERIDYTHLSADGSLLMFTRENLEGDLWVIE